MKSRSFAIWLFSFSILALAASEAADEGLAPEGLLLESTPQWSVPVHRVHASISAVSTRQVNEPIFRDAFVYEPAPVRLSAQNRDHAGGHVTARIGNRAEIARVQVTEFGGYTLDLPGDIDADELIRLVARSEGPEAWRELVSIPASAPRLVAAADENGLLTATIKSELDFSVIGTARWLAVVHAHHGQAPTSFSDYAGTLATIADSEIHALTAVLAIVLEDPRFGLPQLPAGLVGSCETVVDCLAVSNRFEAIRNHIDDSAPGLRPALEQRMQLDWCSNLPQRLWFMYPRHKYNLSRSQTFRRLVSFDGESRTSGLTNEGSFSATCSSDRLQLELDEAVIVEDFPSVMIDGAFVQVRRTRTLTVFEINLVERRLEGDRIRERFEWLIEYPDHPELGTSSEVIASVRTAPRHDNFLGFEPADLSGQTFALAGLVYGSGQSENNPSTGIIEFFGDGTATIAETGQALEWAVDQGGLSLWSSDDLLEIFAVPYWRESDDTPYVLVERLERADIEADWQLNAGSGLMPIVQNLGAMTTEGYYQEFGQGYLAHPRSTAAYELVGNTGWRLFTNPDPNSPDDFIASNSSLSYGWEPTASGLVLRSCWLQGALYEEPESCQFAYVRIEFRLLQMSADRWYVLRNARQWGSGGGADLSEPPISDFSSVVFFERQAASPPWFVATLPGPEREALEDYYQAMDGPNWQNQSGWMGPPGTECRWTGVACSPDLQHVVGLGTFSFDAHSGLLPQSLLQLTELENLNLSISGPAAAFPAWLTGFERLRRLSVLNHPWTGELPASIGNLSQLNRLTLTFGALEGALPATIGQLQNLQHLFLAGNQLSGQIPHQLAQLSALENLDLSNNEFSGQIPDELTQLEALESLRLGGNPLSGPIPENIGALQSLRELSLADTHISGSIPASLGSLNQLQTLLVSNNNLSGNIPSSIGGLSSLLTINLGGNQLTGPIPDSFGNLLQLRSAFFFGNALTGPLPETLGNLNQLSNLNLSDNDLSGSFPSQLSSLTSLRILNLSGNQLSGFLPNWIGELTNLQSLLLQDNSMGGQLPLQLMNLVNLNDSGGINLCNNSFVTANAELDAFLVSKHVGNDWQGCQQ